jgi:hypothetical protein
MLNSHLLDQQTNIVELKLKVDSITFVNNVSAYLRAINTHLFDGYFSL